MIHILYEAAWWLLAAQINAAAWLAIDITILVWWMNFDIFRRFFR